MLLSMLLLGSAALARPSVVSLSSLRGGAKPPGYKLTYFDARGAAELARVVLVVGGAPWEDVRYPISMQGGKPSVPEFQKAKESGALAINMGRVPLLDLDDGFSIGQSRAIERFLARRHGLYGEDEREQASIDAIVEHTRDIKEAFGRAVPPFGPESDEKAAKRDAWYEQALADWLGRLERALPAGGAAGRAVGARPSLADLAIWQLLRDFFPDAARTAKAAEGCPRLTGIADAVGAMPPLAAWVEQRPKTAM
jgi:glutathione S-transferase